MNITMTKNVQKESSIKRNSPLKYTSFERFLFKLLNIFSFLVFGELKSTTTKAIERWNLKKQYKKIGVSFLDISIEKLSPSFPFYMYGVFSLFRRFQNLCVDEVKNITDADSKKAKIDSFFLVHYISSLLREVDRNTLKRIQDAQFFREIIANESNPKQAFEKYVEKSLLEIREKNSEKLQNYLYYFNKLLILRNFDFHNFFVTFDRQFTLVPGYKPVFQAMFGVNAGKHLMSLDSYLKFIEFSVVPRDIIQHIYKELESFNERHRETIFLAGKNIVDAKYMVESIIKLMEKIAFLNKNDVIGLMIRILTNNFNYHVQLKDLKLQKNFLFDQYVQILKLKTREAFLESYDKIQEQLVKQEMLKLFNIQSWDELESIPNYNDKIHNALQAKGLAGFSYLFLMVILKGFFQRIYGQLSKKVINILLLKGKFYSKNDQKELTEHFYTLELIAQQFEAMEQDFNSGELYMRDIVRFAMSQRLDLSMKSIVNRYITKINSRIEDLTCELLKTCQHISDALENACRDWEDIDEGGATLIQNIREIDGIKNEAFYSELSQSSKSLKTFLEMIVKLPVLHLMVPRIQVKI